MMNKFTDQEYLQSEQYGDDKNLTARIDLHRRFSTNPRGWMPWLFDQLEFDKTCRILELGCGTGTLWEKNLSRIPSGWQIFLSDFSPGMVSQARSSLSEQNLKVEFLAIDAQQLPFQSGHFDGVIANHILFHLPDLEAGLAEIQRVLREGGRFYASTIGPDHLGELHDLIARFAGEIQNPELANPAGFTLQNGADPLTRFFSDVSVHRYEDALHITEIQPLIAYVQSMMSESSITEYDEENINALERFLDIEFDREQHIHITKDQGLFSAIRKLSI